MQHTYAYGKRSCVRAILACGTLFLSQGAFAYCSSQGNSTSYEWIDSVTVGSLSNSSGSNNGYLDATQQVVDLAAGSTSISLKPGFRSSSYTERWRVWIDFNKNNSFEDSELVYSGSSRSTLNGSINIPNNAMSGETGMRVAMRYGGDPTSCGNFTYGEVEDYTVNLNLVDSSAPTVVSTVPINSATEVAINSPIEVTFSENIDPLSLNSNTITLTGQEGLVSGQISATDSIVTFSPDQDLELSHTYNVSVSGVSDIAGNPLLEEVNWSFTTTVPDVTAPTVEQTSPQNEDVDVSNNLVVQAKFSEPMLAESIDSSSFTVSDGTSIISGNIQVFGDTAQFYADEPFAYSTYYTATLSADIADLNGNALGEEYSWNFTSRAYQPEYCSASASNYSLMWIKSVQVRNLTASYSGTPYSGYRDSTSTVFDTSRFYNSVQLTPGYSSTQYPVYWRVFIDYNQDGYFENQEIAFEGNGTNSISGSFSIPDSALGGHTRMRVTQKYGAAASACGSYSYGQVADYRVLIPDPVADTTSPSIVTTSPADGAIDVNQSAAITAMISEDLDPETVNTQNVSLSSGVNPITVNVSFDSNLDTLTIVPLDPMEANTLYSVELSTNIQDVVGNALENPVNWSFTTAPELTDVFSVSGSISSNGQALSGVNVTATGESAFSATTNVNGEYEFLGLSAGSYAITASKTGYVFTPQSLTIDLLDSDVSSVDFFGAPANTPLTNGDFETGDFSEFELYETENGDMSTTIISTDANNDGALSLVAQFVVGVVGYSNIGTPGGGGLTQSVALQDGDLNVSLDVTASAVNNNGDGGLVEVFFNNQLMVSHDFGSVSSAMKEYEALSFYVPNVEAGVHELRIQFTRDYFTAPVSQLLDNIVLSGSSIGN